MNPLKKLGERINAVNSLVCVGLDADFEKIPEKFKSLEYPQLEFNKYIIDATAPYALAYKPNSAFYEARGAKGWKELAMTMSYIREKHPTVFTIFDAKRADIGNTNAGYVEAVFDDLQCDAVTLHPYLGEEALQPFLERKDKVSIILCRTSNKGASEFQDINSNGKALWQIVAERVATAWNKNDNCMLVVGATYPAEMKTIRNVVGEMTLLVPGIGAQGGSVKEVVEAGKNAEGKGLIISSSRGIIFSDDPKEEVKKLRDEINLYR